MREDYLREFRSDLEMGAIGDGGELLEEIELNENCDTRRFRIVTLVFNIMLNLSLVKHSKYEAGKAMRLNTSFKDATKFKLATNLLIMLFIFCASCKFFLIAFFQFEHDDLTENLKLEIRYGANQTDSNCVSKQDAQMNEKQVARLDDLAILLQSLGNPIISLRGIATSLFFLVGCVPFFYLITMQAYFATYNIYIDAWAFILNPNGERMRVRDEIEIIVRDLLETFSNAVDGSKKELENDINLFRLLRERRKRSFGDQVFKGTLMSRASGIGQMNERHIEFSKGITGMEIMVQIRTLLEIQLHNLVKPGNLSVDAHRKLILLNLIFLSITVPAFVIVITYTYLVIIVYDFWTRAQYRLEVLKCLRLDSIFTDEYMYLDRLNDRFDIEAYERYDGSYTSLLNLAFIESKPFLNLQVFFTTFELIALTMCAAIWMGLYTYIFVNCEYHKILWIQQLQEQLCECISLIEGNYVRESKLVKALTVAYVDFEIFRRKYGSHQGFMNFLIFQISTYTIIATSYCFMVAKSLKPGHATFLLVGSTSLVAVMNFHLITTGISLNKISNLFKSIYKLVIISDKKGRSKRMPLMSLWRRQLLDLEDLRRMYSLNFLGIYLSYERIITINVWQIVLWYVVVYCI